MLKISSSIVSENKQVAREAICTKVGLIEAQIYTFAEKEIL
jgi:hypothetical protein